MRPRRRLRRSQAVMTFGPGSIVNLRDESIMMAGIHKWPDHSVEIQEPNLQKALGVECFKSPGVVDNFFSKKKGDLPGVLFPRWLVCPKCHRLAPVEHFAGLFTGVHKIKCHPCRRQVFPARLVVACEAGHIDDFPWEWWVHRGTSCARSKPSLKWITLGKSSSLADILITCECGAKRTLMGATNPKNLQDLKCTGNQPWLITDPEPDCQEKVIPVQRGASNVYFSSIRSSISIPPWSDAVHTILNKFWNVLSFIPDDALLKTITDMDLPDRVGLSAEQVVQAIISRKMSMNQEAESVPEIHLRYQEFIAMRTDNFSRNENDEFQTRMIDVSPDLNGFISRVILVDRLREVRALLGFRRLSSPDPYATSGENLAKLSPYPLKWLPGIEVYGEGIYFELDQAKVNLWETHPRVIKRANQINSVYQEMCERRNWESNRKISAKMILIHSLSHALIRQLSLDAGYSSASIRERVYVFDPDQIEEGGEGGVGLLLYTSTVDSEGSLGGLVRQGLPERFAETVIGAILECEWCSSDPLCIESGGQGPGAMNLAACHSCLLIPETSCEEFNRLLDRALLIGTPDEPGIGFFNNLL